MKLSVLFQSDAVCWSYCCSLICHCYCLVHALCDMLVDHLSLSLLLSEGALWLFSNSLCLLPCVPRILDHPSNVNISFPPNCCLNLIICLYEDIYIRFCSSNQSRMHRVLRWSRPVSFPYIKHVGLSSTSGRFHSWKSRGCVRSPFCSKIHWSQFHSSAWRHPGRNWRHGLNYQFCFFRSY